MRLSDIMSNAGLSTYAEIALVIFLIAFLLIAVSVFTGWGNPAAAAATDAS